MTAKLQAPGQDRVARVAELERQLEEQLARLPNERARAFVVAYTKLGVAVRAAVEAGYSEANAKAQAVRLRADPQVKAALAIARKLRDISVGLTREELVDFLEEMLAVRREDYFLFADDGVTPIAMRAWETLSDAAQARIKKHDVRTRRSAKGHRAHYVDLEVELYSALEIADRIARLRDWYPDHRLSLDVAAVRSIPVGGRAESAEARDAAQSYMDRLEGDLN